MANRLSAAVSPGAYTGAAVLRTPDWGVWGGKNGTLFPHFDTITKQSQAASDHAPVYVDLNIA